MLRLEKIYGGYVEGSFVLQGIDLEINPGEIVGIIGLNGCGKSTLGRATMNLLPFRTGKVFYKDRDVSRMAVQQLHDRGISMLMQGGRVFPHMTILEHLHIAKKNSTEKELKKRLGEIEEQYGLVIFTSGIALNRKGSYLSGGEKQQLTLMMALLNKPEFLILDEVSAGLSPSNILMVSDVLNKLKTEGTIGIMMIEQNIKLASQLSDRLLLLERGIIDQQYKITNSFDFNKLYENIFN